MARTALTVQQIGVQGLNGVTVASADAANGMQWSFGGGRRKLYVNNTDAASKTVTVRTAMTVDGLVVPDRAFTVAASAVLGIRESVEMLQADNNCYVDFSAATGVKVWVDELA
jgi:hypothetical protein